MKPRFSGSFIVVASALFALANCSNYDLLNKLESPGQTTAGGVGPRNLRIFVSNAFNNGNLGGIAGADTLCLTDTANPMGQGNGSWKAMIVGGGRQACSTATCSGGSAENVDWALKPNTNYIRPNGLVIGSTNPAGIFSFPVNGPISDLTSTYAWTGLAGDWTIGSNCSGWADGSTGTGDKGQVDKNDAQAINFLNDTCGTSQRLYCVEQ